MAEEERKESTSGVDGVDATMGVEGQAAAAPADEAAGDVSIAFSFRATTEPECRRLPLGPPKRQMRM
jgi:hypothetical protein